MSALVRLFCVKRKLMRRQKSLTSSSPLFQRTNLRLCGSFWQEIFYLPQNWRLFDPERCDEGYFFVSDFSVYTLFDVCAHTVRNSWSKFVFRKQHKKKVRTSSFGLWCVCATLFLCVSTVLCFFVGRLFAAYTHNKPPRKRGFWNWATKKNSQIWHFYMSAVIV